MIRHLYPWKQLSIFYNSLGKSEIAYSLLAYGATAKSVLNLIKRAQRTKTLCTLFHKTKLDSRKHHVLIVYQLCIMEKMLDLSKQIKKAIFSFFLQSLFIPKKVRTRKKEEGLNPVKYPPNNA